LLTDLLAVCVPCHRKFHHNRFPGSP
jgi:hypothetical protein